MAFKGTNFRDAHGDQLANKLAVVLATLSIEVRRGIVRGNLLELAAEEDSEIERWKTFQVGTGNSGEAINLSAVYIMCRLSTRMNALPALGKTETIAGEMLKYCKRHAVNSEWLQEEGRTDITEAFARRLLQRMEALGQLGQTKADFGLQEVGFTGDPGVRIQEHRNGHKTNFLMAIFADRASHLFGRHFSVKGLVVLRIWDGSVCAIAEVAITMLADAWSHTGQGFTYTSPGLSNEYGDMFTSVGTKANQDTHCCVAWP